MKPQRQYKPAKVKDPQTQGYAVRLQARQSFVICLSGIDNHFSVQLNSDFLVIDEVVYNYERDQVQYTIVQKYDLQEWSYISHVFLGNVVVEEGNTGKTTLCVYLECRNRKKYGVLTVINPKDQLVKMEPHQLLQVVLWTEPYVNWATSHNAYLFEEVKYETVINDICHVYDKTDVFCCEPRAVVCKPNPACKVPVDANKSIKKIVEHHYWYRIKKDMLEKASNYENGCYKVGKLTFRHFNNPTCGSTSFEIMVSLRNSTREKIDIVLYDAITHRMTQWQMRQCDLHNQILMNPHVSENIDLAANQDYLYVELPQPSVYFNVFHDNVFWRAESSELTYFHILELEARLVNGKYVQRFFIRNIMDPKNFATTDLAKKMPFVGFVKFVCRKLQELGGKVERVITLNFWKKNHGCSSGVATPSVATTPIPLTTINKDASLRWTGPSYPSNSTTTSYETDEEIVSEVEFEQLVGCDLLKGSSVARLSTISGTLVKNTTYGGIDTSSMHSYYWDKRKKKLKEENNSDLDPSLWMGGI